MSETKLVKTCREVLEVELLGVFLWKVCDRMTGGIPDVFIGWNGATTMIEFKYLKKDETVHQKWEDGRQLVTCVKLEGVTGRCWVVAYQKKCQWREHDQTIIYRPTALLDLKTPKPSVMGYRVGEQWAARLWDEGCVIMQGFDHRAIASLIRQTHR